jgi:hypothetical protein
MRERSIPSSNGSDIKHLFSYVKEITMKKTIRGATVAAAAIAALATGSAYTPVSGNVEEAAPIFGITIPAGYRDWRLISVAREEGPLNDIRAVLGNDAGINAYREAKRPFPDGTIIARLAWSLDPSEENNKAFARFQSFVAGPPKNGVQFMVKDSRRYASTGGWGYAHFNDGKPADEKVHSTCHACHQAAAARDFVFTDYSQ